MSNFDSLKILKITRERNELRILDERKGINFQKKIEYYN